MSRSSAVGFLIILVFSRPRTGLHFHKVMDLQLDSLRTIPHIDAGSSFLMPIQFQKTRYQIEGFLLRVHRWHATTRSL
jgi:hypothetical protein